MQLCWLYLSALFLLIPGNFQVLSSSPLSKIRLLLMFFWLVSSFYLGLRENIKLLERSSLTMPSKIISFFAHSLSIIIYYSLVPDQKCVYVYTYILITRYFMIIYHIRQKFVYNRNDAYLVDYYFHNMEVCTQQLLNKHIKLVIY